MESIKQEKIEVVETLSAFLRRFAEDIERTRKEIEAKPEQREHFIAHGKTRHVRKGNFSDFLMMEQDIATRAADHVLNKIREQAQTKALSHTEHRQLTAAEKLVAFYHTQAKLFAEYAEAVDDEELSELASIMGKEFPYLKEMRDAYMERFKDLGAKE